MPRATNKGSDVATENLQRNLERIKGVLSAGVVRDPRGNIAEIHMEASPSRHPKQIVRDTESLLYTRFGIDLDYRKISLVQLEGATDMEGRLRLVSVHLLPEKGEVGVVLESGGDVYRERADISPDVASKDEATATAAAEATLGAMQKIVGDIVPLKLEDVFLVPTDEESVCLIIISAASSRGRERLTGTAIVRDNIPEAAGKATLDAINRRLVVWTQERKGA